MKLIKLHSWQGFHERVEQNYKDCASLEEAYHQTEGERLDLFGARLYKNYDSFKSFYYRKVREHIRK